MDLHHERAMGSAVIPIIFGVIGFIQAGKIYWEVLAFMVLAAGWLYRRSYIRSQNAEKFGVPPSKSAFFRQFDRHRF